MSDVQMMKDQIDGMIQKGASLRAKEKIFLKLQGLKEEIEKASVDNGDHQKEIDGLKDEIKGLKAEKKNAVADVAKKISVKMSEVLPIGDAVFNVDDGAFFGWKIGKKTTPYDGLSGGQEQIFNLALAHTLKANILALEAGELDDSHLVATLEELGKIDSQVIVNTCHVPQVVPVPFQTITLEA